MLCVYVVRHKKPVNESFIDQLDEIFNALAIWNHVHCWIKLIVGALCAKEIVLQVAAQLGKL